MIEQQLTVIKWGNSAGIRLNQQALNKLNLRIGSTVNLVINDGEAFITKVPTIEEMVNDIDMSKIKGINEDLMILGGFVNAE